MRRALRYAIALPVAFSIALATYHYFSDAYFMVYPAIFLVYVFTIGVGLAEPKLMVSGTGSKNRLLGAIIGGVSAFTFSSLIQFSIPIAVLAWGMLLFGMVTGMMSIHTG
ncbi:hypothetical protein C453_04099 [Haloferax elongans ATCC BAA-1513]|uniref:DUF8153 domain-containing protein n=1 Tax=Haloferax elongans ATCC BAA-1513 TaxID=1230453 RepID=M0HWM3_HALEO|nr:hypothetical protein [Haloferax elongans]ELZ87504.1 hypothetical protein C453_04099 [Haloferax elongans ATCC BAA-1513]